jgi:hypothetical protein
VVGSGPGSGAPDLVTSSKQVYPPPAPVPTQIGPEGIRFDFNFGARVLVPPRPDEGGLWRVRLRDLDTGNVLFESESRGALVTSAKRWFTHKDMDFSNLADATRDRILAGFRVSKTILSTAESDTNRATAETADYVFSKRTIKPKMELIVA